MKKPYPSTRKKQARPSSKNEKLHIHPLKSTSRPTIPNPPPQTHQRSHSPLATTPPHPRSSAIYITTAIHTYTYIIPYFLPSLSPPPPPKTYNIHPPPLPPPLAHQYVYTPCPYSSHQPSHTHTHTKSRHLCSRSRNPVPSEGLRPRWVYVFFCGVGGGRDRFG